MAAQQGQLRTASPASRYAARALAAVLTVGALTACGQGTPPGGEYRAPTPVAVSRASSSSSTDDTPTVRIAGLSEGDEVGAEREIRGTAEGLSRDLQLWVVVRDVRAKVYRPQDDVIPAETWVDWSVDARFGGQAGSYQVLVVSATTKAGNVFQRYLYSVAGRNGPGLEQLPRGVRTLAEVTVTRS